MTGPGRPRVGDKVECRLPADTLSELDRRAAAEGTTRAEQMRRLLIVALADLT